MVLPHKFFRQLVKEQPGLLGKLDLKMDFEDALPRGQVQPIDPGFYETWKKYGQEIYFLSIYCRQGEKELRLMYRPNHKFVIPLAIISDVPEQVLEKDALFKEDGYQKVGIHTVKWILENLRE